MIVGHKNQWKFLRKSVRSSKISHAYLFWGPQKVGKRTVALKFVKLLNCLNRDNLEPCGECRSCKSIPQGSHPDLSVVEPQKGKIKISQIRNLIWNLSLKPYFSPFKTAIIDKAHFMNKSAQNCLLKTLEEPKGQTVLILISPFPQALLPTILSRTEKIRFSPVDQEKIKQYLFKKVPSLEIEEIVSLSEGKPGKAIDLASNPKKLARYHKRMEELADLKDASLSSRFQYVEKISKDFEKTKEMLDIWLRYFRRMFFSKLGASLSFSLEGRELTSPKQFEDYSLLKLKHILDLIQRVNFLLSSTNTKPKLALEILMLEL